MKVWKFGDNIDTDAIIPGRFLTIYDPKELAKHAFEGTRDSFSREVKEGDVIVAGRNFGCGSSREHAPLALKGAGVKMVIAESFARIFFRNAVNVGLLPLVCEGADSIPEGGEMDVDLEKGVILTASRSFIFTPIPPFLQTIISAGGLVDYAKDLEEVPLCTGSQ